MKAIGRGEESLESVLGMNREATRRRTSGREVKGLSKFFAHKNKGKRGPEQIEWDGGQLSPEETPHKAA